VTTTIGVASGKGGTGKTTISVNLAAAAVAAGRRVHLCDCDVEEPNSHLFLRPSFDVSRPITQDVPVVDQDLCSHCGMCAEICSFHAIASMPDRTVVFPDLCHACHGCRLVCPQEAVTMAKREIGVLEQGKAGDITFTHGRLRIGETQVPPLIEAVKATRTGDELAILDAPPGATCPVTATLKGCDLVLLVTEPTPFGLHDLEVAVELCRGMNLTFAIVVNREGSGDDRVHDYCLREGLTLLPGLPFSREAAVAGSRGELLYDAVPDLADAFRNLLDGVLELAEGVTT